MIKARRNQEQFPIEITDKEAERLVMIIKNGSVRSGIIVFKSIAATLTFRGTVKEEKKLCRHLGIDN